MDSEPAQRVLYFAAVHPLVFMVGPATVALAVPLYGQIEKLKAMWWPVSVALLAGSVTAIGTARAFQISETAGAFAAMAMSLNGLMTAMLMPLILSGLPALKIRAIG